MNHLKKAFLADKHESKVEHHSIEELVEFDQLSDAIDRCTNTIGTLESIMDSVAVSNLTGREQELAKIAIDSAASNINMTLDGYALESLVDSDVSMEAISDVIEIVWHGILQFSGKFLDGLLDVVSANRFNLGLIKTELTAIENLAIRIKPEYADIPESFSILGPMKKHLTIDGKFDYNNVKQLTEDIKSLKPSTVIANSVGQLFNMLEAFNPKDSDELIDWYESLKGKDDLTVNGIVATLKKEEGFIDLTGRQYNRDDVTYLRSKAVYPGDIMLVVRIKESSDGTISKITLEGERAPSYKKNLFLGSESALSKKEILDAILVCQDLANAVLESKFNVKATAKEIKGILKVGKTILKNLKKHSRTDTGYREVARLIKNVGILSKASFEPAITLQRNGFWSANAIYILVLNSYNKRRGGFLERLIQI